MKKELVISVLALFTCLAPCKAELVPDKTLCFAHRDTCDLYLDLYKPVTEYYPGIGRPTVIFVFGGGFFSGERKNKFQDDWFEKLLNDGFNVVSIDYRLGLKNMHNPGINKEFLNALDNAIHIAVEDLFSATRFLIDNSGELGIDPGKFIISGSSAGAITSLQAEWELCNGKELAEILPEEFNYAGVMAFSGSILSLEGMVKFKKCPCPILIMHGKDDKIVPYGKMQLFNVCMCGGSGLVKPILKAGGNCCIYRFDGIGHEIAMSMSINHAFEKEFILDNILKGNRKFVDASVSNPEIKPWNSNTRNYKNLYK